MLEPKVCTYGGTIKSLSLDELKDALYNMIKGDILSFSENISKDAERLVDYPIWINTRLFKEKNFITINSKNIEYSTSYHLSDYIMCDKLKNKMEKLKIADVLVLLTVYRLGQYSYFCAECTALCPENLTTQDK